MAFYSEFSKNYDKIFPLKPKKLSLIDTTFNDLKEQRKDIKLLDVGCGTGSYALNLAKKGYQIKAVDLDPEMISLAKSKIKEKNVKVDLYEVGMLDLPEFFPKNTFDGIYIIGNVLVHLKKKKIKEFLRLVKNLLKDEGKIFIQIVNYDRIFALNLDGLPTIYSEDDSLCFERNYKYSKRKEKIYFQTILIDQNQDKILSKNEIELYPLQKKELENILKNNGFKLQKIYGNSKGEKYQKLKSIPLICTAKKI